MAGGGATGFGAGGLPNLLPGRTYHTAGSDRFRDMPDDWVGGARGPAALPSRSTPPNPGDYPAPSNFPLQGAHGAINFHRGAYVEDAGAPRLVYDSNLGHNNIAWSRPRYANQAGRQHYIPPTQQPSWTADYAVIPPPAPAVGIPVSIKKIGSFTVREEYGSTRQFFYNGSLANYVAGIQVGMNQQGKRWVSQAKTKNPSLVNLARSAVAGSYGQTTAVLQTQPTNVPAGGSNPYGSY